MKEYIAGTFCDLTV